MTEVRTVRIRMSEKTMVVPYEEIASVPFETLPANVYTCTEKCIEFTDRMVTPVPIEVEWEMTVFEIVDDSKWEKEGF